MNSSRRRLLAGSATAAALAGCDGVYNSAARYLSGGTPESFARPEGTSIDPDFFFLQRTTWGPAPGDLDRIRKMGREGWVDEQLHPDKISDAGCQLLVRRFESLHLPPGDLYEFKRKVAEDEIKAGQARALAEQKAAADLEKAQVTRPPEPASTGPASTGA